MANQTARDAIKVRGSDPQLFIEKLTRERIYQSRYWRENCYGVTIADVASLATDLSHVGGLYGQARKPTAFICLVLKLLQLGPTSDMLQEFFDQSHFKYATLVAAFYLRVVGDAQDVFDTLEEMLADYRKIVVRRNSGEFELTHIDQVVDDLLVEEDVFGIKLPRMQHRLVLTKLGMPPRVTSLPPDDLS
jgi:pre-mRNA-splicing factor 38A